MKKCPYCAEEIQDEAKVCRHCHIDLVSGKPILKSSLTQPQIKEVEARSRVMDGVRIGVGIFIVLPLIIIAIVIVIIMFFGGIGSLFPNKRELAVKEPTEEKMQNVKNISEASKYRETEQYKDYYNKVRNKIASVAYDNYNKAVVGEISVEMIIYSSGVLKNVNIVEEKSTQNEYLKMVALNSIRKCSPFPAFPEGLNFPELNFTLILSYEIE